LIKNFFLLILIINFFAKESSSTELNKEIPRNILETKDLGLYIYIKVVDENNKPLSGVNVKASNNQTYTDKNGEFVLNVSENDEIFLSLDGYKEEYIKVSDIKSKIKLYKEPNILPIYPKLTFDLSYRNFYFYEKYQSILSQGSFNDSFEINSSLKILDKFLINLYYDNLTGKIKKPEILNDFHSHNINFKANYIYNIVNNRLELMFGINSFFNMRNINSSNSDDYLDFNHSRLGLGFIINSGFRPVRYFPLVLNASISYFPLILVNDTNKFLPETLQSIDFGINSRYDWNNIYLQISYIYSMTYNSSFNSSSNIIKSGIGYAF